MSNSFDWVDNESIVLKQVDAIAIYTDDDNDIVIRQRVPLGDDDSIVSFPHSQLAAVMLALEQMKL